METEAIGLAQHADFSMWALFWRATFTVKLVMILLVLASLWAWAVIWNKHAQYRRARKETGKFETAFWSGEPLDALYDQIGQTPKGRIERVFPLV